MTDNDIRKEILKVNWNDYNGSSDYSSDKVIDSLIKLLELKNMSESESVGDYVINSLGNDHKGVYFPAIIKAIDIIKMILSNSLDNKAREVCSKSILNDFYYFEPEIGSYTSFTNFELKDIVKNKLLNFSDDNF